MHVADHLRERRNDILRVTGKHGASEIRLIGSVARGEARADSDVDLLVKWAPESSLLDHARLVIELEKLLGRRIDIASDGWLRPSVRDSVYRDAAPL